MVVLGSSSPSNIVSVIVCLSDFLFLFVPNLHTIIKDKDVNGTTLSFVPVHQQLHILEVLETYVVIAFFKDSTVGMMTPSNPSL
jgi:hypothetical protein